MNGHTLHLCTACEPHHFDNCGTCFGYGVRTIPHPDAPIPVRRGDQRAVKALGEWAPCPECGSTPDGPPIA